MRVIIKDEGQEGKIGFEKAYLKQVHMSEQEEKYIHLVNSIDSLNTTWRILKKIKDEKRNPLAGFAFQFALIEYSKPYKDSNSAFLDSKGRPVRTYRLKTEYIPQSHLSLHKRILSIRDKMLAHLDLDVRDARVYVQSTERGRNIIRSQNNIDGTEEMKNIDEIIKLIEGTLDAMQEEAKKLGDHLPINI